MQKAATNADNSGLNYTRRYIYNGWNLVAELDSTGTTLQRSYTWGLDVVGSFSATGGVGALLQITDHGANKNYFTAYDHNGNVAALERDDGTLAAAYEYSPFGEQMRADVFDSVVADNPLRFSTKFTDAESGLVYYGMRYYSPAMGRFINKDPIEEAGGLNLYGFCGNTGVNGCDQLGMNAISDADLMKSINWTGRDDTSLWTPDQVEKNREYNSMYFNPHDAGSLPTGLATGDSLMYGGYGGDDPGMDLTLLMTAMEDFANAYNRKHPNDGNNAPKQNSKPAPNGKGPKEGDQKPGDNGTDHWTMTWHDNGPNGPAWYNDALAAPKSGAAATAAGLVVTAPGYFPNTTANPLPGLTKLIQSTGAAALDLLDAALGKVGGGILIFLTPTPMGNDELFTPPTLDQILKIDAKMQPVPGAVGPHTTFKVGPNGEITNYQDWYPQTNPRNPNPWQTGPRVDVTGSDHNGIPTPHVHEPDGTVRPANPSELPHTP